MSHSLRLIKIGMIMSIALFFTLVAIDNIIDFDINLEGVHHVLSMDTIFANSVLKWRAVVNLHLQTLAYYLIIAWEGLTAMVCWIGSVKLLLHYKKPEVEFEQAKATAFLGLFMGFLLYVVGFVVIGGEWFCMWQSSQWNAQGVAGLFASLILLVMIFVK